MRYRVVIQPNAQAELESAFEWLFERVPEVAAKWLNEVQAAIQELDTHPERYPIADESDDFNIEIRQLIYGKRQGVHRILYIQFNKMSFLCLLFAIQPGII